MYHFTLYLKSYTKFVYCCFGVNSKIPFLTFSKITGIICQYIFFVFLWRIFSWYSIFNLTCINPACHHMHTRIWVFCRQSKKIIVFFCIVDTHFRNCKKSFCMLNILFHSSFTCLKSDSTLFFLRRNLYDYMFCKERKWQKLIRCYHQVITCF